MTHNFPWRLARKYSIAFILSFTSCGGFGCSSGDSDEVGGTGGQNAQASTGGQATGGNFIGGSASGGFASGGFASGGFASGGFASGGSASGGFASGGSASGGESSVGGASTGGAPAAETGGASTGGGINGGSSGGESGSGGDAGNEGTGGESGEITSPCPETGPCKILPLGDSITFGMGSSGGGYRVELFRLALEAGHDITFTGTQSPNGPEMVDGVAFPKNHAGISGETIEQITGRIPAPDLQDVPHIILLHAGTNDMWAGAAGAPDRLQSLVDLLIANAPDALIVVSNLIPWPQQATSIGTFNAEVSGIVALRADVGAKVIFVDQFTDFPESELDDGIHPNDTGYARMAAKWYEAIDAYLP